MTKRGLRRVQNPPSPFEQAHVEWDVEGEPAPDAELDVYEEETKRAVAENDSPDVGFRWSINPYRGCYHACAYCLHGDTPVLLTDGRHRAIRDLRVGDDIYGTLFDGKYRRYAPTRVLAHWSTVKPAFRVELDDGRELVASGDHRFLTRRGWKHVTGTQHGAERRPHLTLDDVLLGSAAFALTPAESNEYRRGYLCGLIRGDGMIGTYVYDGRRRGVDRQYQFRLALADLTALDRGRRYLREYEVETRDALFQAATATRREVHAIRTHARESVERIRSLVAWPTSPSREWRRGLLAGIFDAEGSYSRGILRIANGDRRIVDETVSALACFGFDGVVETRRRKKLLFDVRVRGGLSEHLRFFHIVDPAIRRKCNVRGFALKRGRPVRVRMIEALGVDLELFDITTGTGDFIANGVVSHNCYARSSHQYLGFGAGTDFERKIVVKTNLVERLRETFEKRSWRGEKIAFSGNTDCYQPLEARYGITRACLELCLEYRNPVGIITKSALIKRDVELIAALAREARCTVTMSIAWSDDDDARRLEPTVTPPSVRFEVMRRLHEAGVPVGVGIAPVIPGLNDMQVPAILERARASGASHAFMMLIRLSGQTLPVFDERLCEAFPQRAQKVRNAIMEMRGGKMNDTRFGARKVGAGARWRAIEQLFEAHKKKLGYEERGDDPATSPFRRPRGQLELF